MINSINQITKTNNVFQSSKTIDNPVQSNALNQNLPIKRETLLPNYYYPVTFKGNSINLLKKQPDIPCMYCNISMLSAEQQGKFAYSIKDATGWQLIRGLNKYYERLPKTEKKICHLLIETSIKHPEHKLNDLLKDLIEEKNIKFLRKEAPDLDEHIEILDEISENAEHLTGKIQTNTNRSIENLRQSFIERDKNALFAREKFIQEIGEYKRIEKKSSKPNRENIKYLEKIKNKALKLPSLGTYSDFLSNVDDFILNYADKSNKKIALRLVRPISSSIDHIKPRKLKGEDTAANKGLACVKCNMEKRYLTLFQYIKKKPKVVENPQHFIDITIKLITDNDFRQLYTYPQEFKNTIKKESGIMLDISEMEAFLKPKKQINKSEVNLLQTKSSE